jgi:hypothetical protein
MPVSQKLSLNKSWTNAVLIHVCAHKEQYITGRVPREKSPIFSLPAFFLYGGPDPQVARILRMKDYRTLIERRVGFIPQRSCKKIIPLDMGEIITQFVLCSALLTWDRDILTALVTWTREATPGKMASFQWGVWWYQPKDLTEQWRFLLTQETLDIYKIQ